MVKINGRIMEENEIVNSKIELLECIQNLMGAFDNPIVRRKFSSDFFQEVIKNGRKILEENKNFNQ